MKKPSVTRESIINEAKRIASKTTGGALSRHEFERVTGIADHFIYKFFPEGGWAEVVNLAGIRPHPMHNKPLSDDEILREYHRVVLECGKIPPFHLFASKSTISRAVVQRRFGALQNVLKQYRAWLERNEPASPAFDLLQARSKHETPAPPALAPSATAKKPSGVQWAKSEGVQYGSPISFRGLRHAPINEQGVVYLFGMVSYELGFLVEAVHQAFPDCEAKRCIDRNKDRWQRVRIEFEYKSRNFLEHGHDAEACDVIVCWENDWKDCPLEVVELRRVINELDG